MPKLNLQTAKRIKIAGVEASALKGQGFAWTKPLPEPDRALGPADMVSEEYPATLLRRPR